MATNPVAPCSVEFCRKLNTMFCEIAILQVFQFNVILVKKNVSKQHLTKIMLLGAVCCLEWLCSSQ